jgi:lysophospholipase L1-like esterase
MLKGGKEMLVRSLFIVFIFLFFSSVSAAPAVPVYAWGDSLTFGINASGRDRSWPRQLASASGRVVVNLGFPGQTSLGIAQRMGARPIRVSVASGLIPARGPVTVTSPDTQAFVGFGGNELRGSLDGVPGALINANPELFVRKLSGSEHSVQGTTLFKVDNGDADKGVTVIWACRNDIVQNLPVATCLDNVAAMVAYVREHSQRFIVLSVLNAAGESPGTRNYEAMRAINEGFRNQYPHNYIDVRRDLVAAGAADANDTIASSLRLRNGQDDGIHLNDDGYAIVAKSVGQFISRRNW